MAPAPDRLVEQHGDPQAGGQLQGLHDPDEHERVPDRRPEAGWRSR